MSAIERQVFALNCSTASCHGAGKAGGLDLRPGSHARLVDVAPTNAQAAADGLARVTPGDLEKSLLYLKLQHQVPTEYGARMPQTGLVLDAAAVDAIRQWILEGAADD